VTIDIAKKSHDAFIQFSNSKTLQMKNEKALGAYQRLWTASIKSNEPVRIGFEPTADYHRNIAYWSNIRKHSVI